MRHADLEPAMPDLGIAVDVVEPVDRSARHPERLEHGDPLRGRLFAQRQRDCRNTRVPIRDTRDVIDEAGIACDIGYPRRRAELSELAVVADCEDEVAVARRESLIGTMFDARCPCVSAVRRRSDSSYSGLRATHPAIEHAMSICCPSRSGLARAARRARDARIHAGHGSAMQLRLSAAAARRIVAPPGEAHEAAHALDHEIVACAVA